ncbi:MAG: DUF1554 domain-containing protein, partial [Leptospiraceae bacterium]|nr:DUF1554 domain-containing protein [Leptospiraceae bacterium]
TIFTTNGSSTFSFGALTNAISSSAASVWTGLNSDWTSSTDHCTNWSISNASKAGIAGNGAATDGTVILDGSIDTKCNNLYYLICVEQ